MARRKLLPIEIAAKSARDLEASTKVAREALTNPVWEALAKPDRDLPGPSDTIRWASEAAAQKFAEISPSLMRPLTREDLAELLELERQRLVADLGTRKKGGRPRKFDHNQVRSFVRSLTPPGEKLSSFTRRRACKEFEISGRQLRRILSGQN
jgi:hypothetical protein